ncbi:MAG: hypothetical protein NWF14_02355 [Candidatus Bathyarchaeota archaeon]|nr:hypothetical protein [Candidatus Bathyarchaeota archaeon]
MGIKTSGSNQPSNHKAKKMKAGIIFSPNDDRTAPNKAGLKPGHTVVFRNKDGRWYYTGDFRHCEKEDIDDNAKVLWKILKTVGTFFPSCYGISKDYQCNAFSLHLRYDVGNPPYLPPFGRIGCSREYTIELAEGYGEPVKPLETEEPEGSLGDELSLLAQAIIHEDPETLADYDVNVITTDLPIISIQKSTIPEVEEYLAEGSQEWDPENDFDLMRQGGLEMIHPFLRKRKTLVWREEEIVWEPSAFHMRVLHNKRFSRIELKSMKGAELKEVCFAKNLSGVQHRKYDMIDAILEANYNIVEESILGSVN